MMHPPTDETTSVLHRCALDWSPQKGLSESVWRVTRVADGHFIDYGRGSEHAVLRIDPERPKQLAVGDEFESPRAETALANM